MKYKAATLGLLGSAGLGALVGSVAFVPQAKAQYECGYAKIWTDCHRCNCVSGYGFLADCSSPPDLTCGDCSTTGRECDDDGY